MTTVLPSTPASATAWEPFRALLRTQREDCLRQHELALAEGIASRPDPVAVTRAGVLSARVEAIDAALARIEDGSYGICTSCGEAIPQERLEFRPHAISCVGCAQPAR